MRPSLLRNYYLWAAIGGLILIPVIRPLTRRVPAPPTVTGQAPHFVLTDQRGGAFGSRDLKDRVYLAAFIGERCEALCDAKIAALVKLEQRCRQMGVPLWLLTISTDPDLVTLAELRARIERHGGAFDRWILLTDRGGATRRLLDGGFQPLADGALGRAGPRSLAQTRWSLLVDGEGGVRGAYPIDENGLYEVFHRAQHVMSLHKAWRKAWR